jgi:hypothetical protein
MVRNGVLDMVKVGDTYQVIDPGVICLPDLTKRERAKQIRDDYIDFLSASPPRPRAAKESKPKYVLQPRSILAASVHLECKRKDTALSYALGKAAGYKLMKEGDDPLSIINPIYEIYTKKKRKPVVLSHLTGLDAIETHTKFVADTGWVQQQDGSFVRVVDERAVIWNKPPESPVEHSYDNFIKKYGLIDEQERYERHVKGEVRCG